MRNVHSVLLLVLAMAFVGCSGGGDSGTSEFRIRCLGGQAFCIISCDLGCNQTGCSVTEIAENQRIRFKFSDAVDPDTVNGASLSIRTAAGVAPTGDFEVQGNEVTFVPRVSTSGTSSTFGFRRNESYVISLAGGPSAAQGIKNLAGDALSERFSCTVVASLGVQDADGLPPTVELLSPVDPSQTPTTPTIVLRFSELIDTTPLQVAISDASPIRAVLRGTLPDGSCNSDAVGIPLSGVPQLSTEVVGNREVTVVSFQPSNSTGPITLPGNSCITVRVTADLRDLSGRSAVPARFDLFTVAGMSTPIVRIETFQNASGQLASSSGGIWSNGARPGVIGSDGRHGPFNYENAPQDTSTGIYIIDTDNFTIPASQTLTGQEYVVTDGRFYFSEFVLPAGVRLSFTGSSLPIITVRGEVDIQGEIVLSGESLPSFIPATGLAAGLEVSTYDAASTTAMPGTLGGVGAGRGGNGAAKCLNAGAITVGGIDITDGQPGEDVRVPGGHAYASQVANTGGRGGPMVPATGIWPNPAPPLIGIYVPYWCRGGAGGGFMGPGGQPVSLTPPVPSTLLVINEPVAAAGGVAFPLLPFPVSPPADYQSVDHYLVAGSGGGGGGSHGYGKIGLGSFERWMGGHAGTGGGGACAIRAGGNVTIGATALLESRGGKGVLINGDNPGTSAPDVTNGISSPGGGGSGGSFLIQSGRNISCSGVVDVRGAQGSEVGRIAQTQLNPPVTAHGFGGQGANGFYRFEAQGTVSLGSSLQPAPGADNQAGLTDRDNLSGDTSTWRSTGLFFPPTWVGYELDVDTDGDGTVDITYSDSGDASMPLAWEADGPTLLPVKIEFQGANLDDITGEPVESSIGAWRAGVGSQAAAGLNLDAVTGFRFNIVYNRAMFPNLVVRELRVTAQS